MQKQIKSISFVLLSIITLGIFDLFVIAKLSKTIAQMKDDKTRTPSLEALLSLATFGIYKTYWYYTYGKMLYSIKYAKQNGNARDISGICAILNFLGLGFFSLGIFYFDYSKLV
ncbi:MAG: DUF4234 domain-containing protein [Clostridia bacterium]|nr:DUF4234 domain-containing protein [Clostridia bacterium]